MMRTALQQYERFIEPVRNRARELGYAIAVHGTLVRDIDLVAIPWVEEACSARELSESVESVLLTIFHVVNRGWAPGRGQDFTLDGCPGVKPHGRRGYTFVIDGGSYIDLSVMPRRSDWDAD